MEVEIPDAGVMQKYEKSEISTQTVD